MWKPRTYIQSQNSSHTFNPTGSDLLTARKRLNTQHTSLSQTPPTLPFFFYSFHHHRHSRSPFQLILSFAFLRVFSSVTRIARRCFSCLYNTPRTRRRYTRLSLYTVCRRKRIRVGANSSGLFRTYSKSFSREYSKRDKLFLRFLYTAGILLDCFCERADFVLHWTWISIYYWRDVVACIRDSIWISNFAIDNFSPSWVVKNLMYRLVKFRKTIVWIL